MKQTPLTRRLGEQLREKLGYILLFEIADPAPRPRHAHRRRGGAGSFLRPCVRELRRRPLRRGPRGAQRRQGRIRSLLACALDWRVTPELAFQIDRSTDEAEAISRALENVPATLSVEKDEFGYPLADSEGEDTDSDEEDVDEQ